jgi:hypothetical protein
LRVNRYIDELFEPVVTDLHGRLELFQEP